MSAYWVDLDRHLQDEQRHVVYFNALASRAAPKRAPQMLAPVRRLTDREASIFASTGSFLRDLHAAESMMTTVLELVESAAEEIQSASLRDAVMKAVDRIREDEERHTRWTGAAISALSPGPSADEVESYWAIGELSFLKLLAFDAESDAPPH